MDKPRGYFTKWNKTKKDTNIVWFHLYVESKKSNKITKQCHTETKEVVVRGEEHGDMSETGKGN